MWTLQKPLKLIRLRELIRCAEHLPLKTNSKWTNKHSRVKISLDFFRLFHWEWSKQKVMSCGRLFSFLNSVASTFTYDFRLAATIFRILFDSAECGGYLIYNWVRWSSIVVVPAKKQHITFSVFSHQKFRLKNEGLDFVRYNVCVQKLGRNPKEFQEDGFHCLRGINLEKKTEILLNDWSSSSKHWQEN